MPSHIDFDEVTKIYTVNGISDVTLANVYTVTVTHEIIYPTNAAFPSDTENRIDTEEIIIIVKPACTVTALFINTVFADPVVYDIGETGFNLPFLFE